MVLGSVELDLRVMMIAVVMPVSEWTMLASASASTCAIHERTG